MSADAFPSFDDLHDSIRFEKANGTIWLEQQRMLLLHASALGAMRQELIDSLGLEYTRGLIMRMGSASGQADGHLAQRLRSGSSLRDIFAVGPQLHSVEGIVNVEPVELVLGDEHTPFYGEFLWRNSFEASEHLRLFGISDEPVCWQLIGYACGYSTVVMGEPIYFKEVECVGKGDSCCRIVGKRLEDWDDAQDLERLFAKDSLSDRLEDLRREVLQLRTVVEENQSPETRIIADSPAIKESMFMLEKAAETDVTVLMLGETGVGKEVFSRGLHEMGSRSDGAFVAVNCAALPRTLIEAELFGVEKGAYTGADKSRPGRFEIADGGSLFLDELGELSDRAQAKLLRVLQTGEFERVGSTKSIKVDVRLIAATNADLLQRVQEGSFRADLYYRLNVFPITIPPLRERQGDLPGLIEKFIARHNAKYGKTVVGVTDEAMQKLKTYAWPGNVRELENILERGVILSDNHAQIHSGHICVGALPEPGGMVLGQDGSLVKPTEEGVAQGILASMQQSQLSYDDIERSLLEAALGEAEGNVEAAARLLGLSGPQCRYRLKKLGLV